MTDPTDTANERAGRPHSPIASWSEMIVTLELAPGSIATEGALIERLGLGRTPVREAIQRLAWEGSDRGAPPLRHRHRAAASAATGCASSMPGGGSRCVLARSAARYVTARPPQRFHDGRVGHAEGGGGRRRDRFLEADKAFDEALGAGSGKSVRGAARRAAANPQPPLLVPLQGRDRLAEAAEQHVALIRAFWKAMSKPPSAEAERLRPCSPRMPKPRRGDRCNWLHPASTVGIKRNGPEFRSGRFRSIWTRSRKSVRLSSSSG